MKNNKIKEMLNNIKVNKDLDDKIFSKTIYKKNNILWQKIVITISVIIIIGTASFGFVHANDIVQKIKGLFVTYTVGSDEEYEYKYKITEVMVTNKKELNYEANLTPGMNTNEQYYMPLDKLEKELNTKFLRPDKFSNKKEVRIGRIDKIDNKITRGGFSYDYIYKNKKEKISMSAQFITKYYSEDSFSFIEGVEWHDSENGVHTKHYSLQEKNDVLNTDIYFYSNYDFKDKDQSTSFMNASFIYDDVLYSLRGVYTNKAKLLEIINSLHY